jgi:hypothetical protein
MVLYLGDVVVYCDEIVDLGEREKTKLVGDHN